MNTLPGTPNPEAPNPQLPIVQKLRIRYTKRGRMRFASHRDFGRAFERAVRRARIPIAYSSGYTPHPKISYAGAAPTGAGSDAEYLEIGVTELCEPGTVRQLLDEALPDGLDVIDVQLSKPGPLADLMEASHWRLELPGIAPEQAAEGVATFLAADEVPVERMTKRGLRRFDCRSAVATLRLRKEESAELADEPQNSEPCAILDLVVRHGTPSVRPDDVLAGLRDIGGLAPLSPPRAHRIAQGPLDPQHGTVGDPLT